MKKLLTLSVVAAAVLTATTASASITLSNKDGVHVYTGGSLSFSIGKTFVKTTATVDKKQITSQTQVAQYNKGSAFLTFGTRITAANNFVYGGDFRLSFSGNLNSNISDNSPYFNSAYLYLSRADIGTFKLGQTGSAYNTYNLSDNISTADTGKAFYKDNSDSGLRLAYVSPNLSGAVISYSYTFKTGKEEKSKNTSQRAYALNLTYDVNSDVQVQASLAQSSSADVNNPKSEVKSFSKSLGTSVYTGVKYKATPELSVAYGVNVFKGKTLNITKKVEKVEDRIKGLEHVLSAKYAIAQVPGLDTYASISLGKYLNNELSDKTIVESSASGFVKQVGVSYKKSGVTFYAELAHTAVSSSLSTTKIPEFNTGVKFAW